MPIFMDRHNLKGVTAAELADAHRKDLEIQEQSRVKFRTYWYVRQLHRFSWSTPPTKRQRRRSTERPTASSPRKSWKCR